MQGLGSFMKETRTLCVSDFIQPIGENVSAVVYEMIWRYFSAFGEIEVIYDFVIIKGFKFGFGQKYGIYSL